MNNQIKQLKGILEGKRILLVEEGKGNEGPVVRITTDDGFIVDISATDLGWWMMVIPGKEGYRNLADLVEAYGAFVRTTDTFGDAETKFVGDVLIVTGPDGSEFNINVNNLTQAELDALTDEEDGRLFCEVINCGGFFKSAFNNESKVKI
jgi:hypothetical protein